MNRWLIALSVLIIGVLIVGAYNSSAKSRAEREKIASLTRDIAALEEEIKLLKIEVAHLSSDTHIEALAREKLGLRLPDPNQIVSMPEEAVETHSMVGGPQ